MSSRIPISLPFCGKIKMTPEKIRGKIYGVVCPDFGTVPIPESIIITDSERQKVLPYSITYDGELIFTKEVFLKYKNQELNIIFLENTDINSLSISDLDSKQAVLKSLRNIETLNIFLYRRMMFCKYMSKYKGVSLNTWIISNQTAISDDGKIIFFEKCNDDFPRVCTLEEWCYLNRPYIRISSISNFKNLNCEHCNKEFNIFDVLNANIVTNRRGLLKHKNC